MRFFLGIHQPIWLTRVRDVPILVSHRRLGHRRTLPRAITEWALDSGGFTELQLHGRWHTDEHSHVQAVRRYATEIGNLDWAAPRDRMCEQRILKRTGFTVREHQRRTVRNLLRLRELAPEIPWVPTVQGWTLSDYERCADLYERAGIDLAAEPLIGIGTVCRRQSSAEIERIMRAFAMRGLKLHGFGIKITGLNRYADALSARTPCPGVGVADTCPDAGQATAPSRTACASPSPGTAESRKRSASKPRALATSRAPD